MSLKITFSLFILGIFLFVSLIHFFPVHAFSLEDITNNIKERLQKLSQSTNVQELTLTSAITHAPDGDINKNGQFDAGDIVRFTYTITNTTEKDYSFATLRTNIQRAHLNFIHNIQGTASLSDQKNTITIPHLRINANQKVIISFDARLNYFQGKEAVISSEPELVTQNNTSLLKSEKKEVHAKPWKGSKLPSALRKK